MSLRRLVLIGACAAAAGLMLVIWRVTNRSSHGPGGVWNPDAIHATLETVVPAHNDVSFRYVIENRTARDYRVADESEVTIVGRSKSTGDLIPKAGAHVVGEFPVVVPSGRKVHFALIWTADREVDTAGVGDFIASLNLRSFVVFDRIRHYQLEFPLTR